MSLFQTNKPKSAGKVMIPPGDTLSELVLSTLKDMADMAGATLGPLGRQVLLERPEMELKPIVTKDGVTVIKHMGYRDAVQQLVLEAARDAAIQTAADAGDGTTTATILSHAIAERASLATKANPNISPQAIIREMKKTMPEILQTIERYKVDLNDDNFHEILTQVAKVSANADEELAESIIQAFDTVGDEGNITIVEKLSPESRYEVERLNGYTIEKGYEESCKKFAPAFVNNPSNNTVELKKPIFLLYNGQLTHVNQFLEGVMKLDEYFHNTLNLPVDERNIVIVAHSFADEVLSQLYNNWTHPDSKLKIFPMLTQTSMIMNYQIDFLYDLQAYTGSSVFDPGTKSLLDLDPETVYKNSRVQFFECSRFRASVMCDEDPEAIDIRVQELKSLLKNPESDLEKGELELRIGKLTSGIAKLIIYAPSSGEGREKKDRAEDAWMAIRGAVKNGATPGGGFVLVKLSADLLALSRRAHSPTRRLALEIIGEALLEPVRQLYKNYGWSSNLIDAHLLDILNSDRPYDINLQSWVDPLELLDSAPAVSEAIRNSLSIASLLGTLGGIVSFQRDSDTDWEEQRFKTKFERTIGERR